MPQRSGVPPVPSRRHIPWRVNDHHGLILLRAAGGAEPLALGSRPPEPIHPWPQVHWRPFPPPACVLRRPGPTGPDLSMSCPNRGHPVHTLPVMRAPTRAPASCSQRTGRALAANHLGSRRLSASPGRQPHQSWGTKGHWRDASIAGARSIGHARCVVARRALSGPPLSRLVAAGGRQPRCFFGMGLPPASANVGPGPANPNGKFVISWQRAISPWFA